MATILEKSVWVYAPKTGSTFADAVLRNCVGGETFNRGSTHWMFHELPKRFRRGRVPITIVRHPVAWYRSYYASRTRAIAKGAGKGFSKRLIAEVGHPLEMHRRFARVLNDTFLSTNNFEHFAWSIVTHHPGILSEMFRAFAAPCEFVCKTETIHVDIVDALRMTGENVSVEDLLATPPLNRSNALPECNEPVEQMILESERYTIERWYS